MQRYRGAMKRRSPLALAPLPVAIVIVLLLLSSCRSEDNSIPEVAEEDRIIATASMGPSDTELLLTWFPVECERFERVEVEHEDRYVNLRIKVTVDIENCPPAGQSETIVDIGQEVGDRKIWDRAFNDTVALDE